MDTFEPLSATERLYRLLDSSPDIARLIKIAQELGPLGTQVLANALERMANGKAPWLAKLKEARPVLLGPLGPLVPFTGT